MAPEIDEATLTALTARADAADSAVGAATAAATQLAAGVSLYRERVTAQYPTIPADVIHGDDFAAIDASVGNAIRVADAAVAAATAAATAAKPVQVPASSGAAAPQHDTTDMSPVAKIAFGLAQRASAAAQQV